MENIARKVIVSGHVQGVGFRYSTFREAQKLGLNGHAKNLPNGHVEVILLGEQQQINTMLLWLQTGPKTARVDNIVISELPYFEKSNFSCL